MTPSGTAQGRIATAPPRWPDQADVAVLVAAAIGPLVLAGWIDGIVPVLTPLAMAARLLAAIAARRLLTGIGVAPAASVVGAGLYGAAGLIDRPMLGAALALWLLGVLWWHPSRGAAFGLGAVGMAFLTLGAAAFAGWPAAGDAAENGGVASAVIGIAAPALTLAVVMAATRWTIGPRRRSAAIAIAALLALIGVTLAGRKPPRLIAILSVDAPAVTASSLDPGAVLSGVLPPDTTRTGRIARIAVQIGTFGGQADGSLAVSLCFDTDCRTAQAPLPGAADNGFLTFRFDSPLGVSGELATRWDIAHVGGTMPVAIWRAPVAATQSPAGPAGALPEMSPRFNLSYVADSLR